jgi:hypothetical protein
MAAMANILRPTIAFCYWMNAMSEDIAPVSNFLMKIVLARISRQPGIEERRMAANFADKLMVTIALSHFYVSMTKKEAGESMSNARHRAVYFKIVCLA